MTDLVFKESEVYQCFLAETGNTHGDVTLEDYLTWNDKKWKEFYIETRGKHCPKSERWRDVTKFTDWIRNSQLNINVQL